MPVISERKHKGYLFTATLPNYKQTYVLALSDFTPVDDSERHTLRIWSVETNLNSSRMIRKWAFSFIINMQDKCIYS